jgi:hypothetical protein
MKRPGWRGVALVVVLAAAWHAPLFWRAESPAVNRVAAEHRAEQVFMILEPPAVPGKAVAGFVDWLDPTVFALPSERGFSSAVRHRAPAARLSEGEAQSSLLPWLYEPLCWARGAREGTSFAEPPPSFGGLTVGEEPATALPEEASAWRVYGEIARRNPTAPSSLPPVERDEPVGPTVVRAAVSPRGEVPYAFLERSSGFERVDDVALRFVQSLRFAPAEGTNAVVLSWGFVKVLWRGERPVRKGETMR